MILKNQAANAPIIFEEFIMVMIMPDFGYMPVEFRSDKGVRTQNLYRSFKGLRTQMFISMQILIFHPLRNVNMFAYSEAHCGRTSR